MIQSHKAWFKVILSVKVNPIKIYLTINNWQKSSNLDQINLLSNKKNKTHLGHQAIR